MIHCTSYKKKSNKKNSTKKTCSSETKNKNQTDETAEFAATY